VNPSILKRFGFRCTRIPVHFPAIRIFPGKMGRNLRFRSEKGNPGADKILHQQEVFVNQQSMQNLYWSNNTGV
jgi:hypothetical protein